MAKINSGYTEFAGFINSGGDEDGVVTGPQFFEAGVAANLEVQDEFDAASPEAFDAAHNHRLLQLEAWNAVSEQAAGAVVAVISGDAIAALAKQAGWVSRHVPDSI